MNLVVPAGHAASVASKAYAAETKSDLEKAFLEIADPQLSDHKRYRHAVEQLREIAFTSDDLHGLLLQHRNRAWVAGHFVSAAYNAGDEYVVKYDLDLPISHLGYSLHGNRLLVNCGRTGNFLGLGSCGVVLNLGNTGDYFGTHSAGMIINAGRCGRWVLTSSEGGVAIALRPPEHYCKRARDSRMLPHFAITDDLQNYLEALANACKNPAEEIVAKYGKIPADTIRKDIEKILRNERGTP